MSEAKRQREAQRLERLELIARQLKQGKLRIRQATPVELEQSAVNVPRHDSAQDSVSRDRNDE